MTPILTIPIATGVVFIAQLWVYLATGRKYKAPDYPSATRKYPLIVEAKLDKDL